MLKITNLRVGVDSKQELEKIVAKRLQIATNDIIACRVVKKSVDARKKHNICFVYAVVVEVVQEQIVYKKWHLDNDVQVWELAPSIEVQKGEQPLQHPPVVVGAGPAGLFATYMLAKHGYAPIMLERGKRVQERSADVESFWHTGCLNTESNVQFGEGGAGTFSDGKLTTRTSDPAIADILQVLVECGAPEEILYKNKPHIGTDVLKNVVSTLTDRIVELGGRAVFNARVEDLILTDEAVQGVRVAQTTIPTQALVLAVGHSARDTYRMLVKHDVQMQAKPLAIGARIEHYQEFINQMQYGKQAVHMTEAADYMITYQDAETARGVYSFCMCPGGTVVASTNVESCVVTNGMSMHKRDGELANSALVVTVDERDYGEGVLAVMDFQEGIERRAFAVAGGNYAAPAQSVRSFLTGGVADLQVDFISSYQPQVVACRLAEVLPTEVVECLKRALRKFEMRMPGFTENALLVAPETRTSAPVRIMRGTDYQSNVRGLYPAGEGAGYAGGIISAAVDGYKIALKIMEQYAPMK